MPRAFERRLCGLCGNFNGVATDDLRGPDGTLYADGPSFAHSWIRGGGSGGSRRKKRGRNNNNHNAAYNYGADGNIRENLYGRPIGASSHRRRFNACSSGVTGGVGGADSVVSFRSPCRGGGAVDMLRSHRRCGFFKHPDLRVCRRLVDPIPFRNACVRDVCRCRKEHPPEEEEAAEEASENNVGGGRTQRKRWAPPRPPAGRHDVCACKAAASYLRRCVIAMAEEKRRVAAAAARKKLEFPDFHGHRRRGDGGLDHRQWTPYDLGKIMMATGCKINKYTLGFSP